VPARPVLVQQQIEMASGVSNPMIDLESFDKESGTLNVIIDTPKGSRNKFKYEENFQIFKLAGALPLGFCRAVLAS
jgi:hypothetical protein